MILSDGITSIGESCFQGCTALNKITLPSTLLTIGAYAFSNTGLSEISFAADSKLETVPNFAFYGCKSLSSISLPTTISSLGQYSFAFSGLINFNLPSFVQYIDMYCFQGCTQLTTFSIPSSSKLENISFGVFMGCPSFATIENKSPNFSLENTALFDRDKTQFIVLPPQSKVKYFYFPDSLRIIRPYALSGCKNLETILIPSSSVIEINQNAFMNCSNLRQINFPASIQTIGSSVFSGCRNLQCGLVIENRNSSFINDLVRVSKLPIRCVKPCIDKCTINCMHQMRTFTLKYCFIFVLIA